MEREFLSVASFYTKFPSVVCAQRWNHLRFVKSQFVWVGSKKCFHLKRDKVDKEEAEANATQTESKTNIVIYNFNLPNKADNLIKTTSRNKILLACASRNQGRAENAD